MGTESEGTGGPPPGVPDWRAIQAGSDFQQLRKRLRGFVFPVTAAFLVWYLLYVLLASFAPGFMSIRVLGNINIGLIFGLLQIVSTFAITIFYVRFADRSLDPLSSKIREEAERSTKR
ncbi:DUF485 domain-containing protein [Pseudonocardia sp. C8]|uniref:DUF485 domain-containing protein n=1 Tax=Pseudonocardia sp. C8 TaxID=2762759 RepID=UPI001643137D|nr:DUF485 domain-containing protein [Pseudonocardia sp. C8]MBC3190255.1 DUF485 domain-containing protein [Pseudonocardia sp. C8]